MASGIAVLGDGKAQIPTLRNIGWLANAASLFYWGDMDASSLEMLSMYRESGLRMKSLFMDMRSYERYKRFGTDTDKHGRTLPPNPNATALGTLTPTENELYLHLCSPSCKGPRRIEQKRIPLAHMQAELASLLSDATTDDSPS